MTVRCCARPSTNVARTRAAARTSGFDFGLDVIIGGLRAKLAV